MRKLVLGVLVVPLAVLLVALAVVNRKPVTLGLNPFDSAGQGIEAPLFLFLLGAFAFGLIVGSIATWFGQSRWRYMARVQAREANAWRLQADRLEKELGGDEARLKPARLPAD